MLSTVPVMFSYWAKPEDCLDLCQILNNHIAACVAENPKRFVGPCAAVGFLLLRKATKTRTYRVCACLTLLVFSSFFGIGDDQAWARCPCSPRSWQCKS